MTNLKRSAIATALTLTLVSGLAACGSSDDAKPAEAATSVSPSASPSEKEAKNEDTSESKTGKSSSKSKPSPSPSSKGPYKPATPKRPAQNVPVPGPLPEVAKEESKAGQVAFVEHWFEEVNYAWEVGSFRKEFWDITSRKCEYSQAINRTFKRMKKDNAWVVGGKIRLEKVHAPNRELDDGNLYVTFTVHEGKRTYFRPGQTTPVESSPPGTTDALMLVLERQDNGWQARGLYGAEE